ncbi:AAA family ATPase [Obesumbacterium proteus]|uniref:AAA family ATPase n=1 Tax=Obesumbacterium proteus TaxID=82983 RepID=UPI001F344938|nr:AAA family ATPase [Obesumbacterium proteus]MCE9883610.1 ATP-binding protein [Obesumbacterium proteus]MCE9915211.1 ATP-binding protein [Obesumbacterium proteus]MCE9927981.1 ATP-binding protein [Obesumbacterium proteus]MCG2877219.1 ATP-binding protein [Obesumbacterium proteus]
MIVGVFLRYFKTYSGTNYIPLSSGSNFCGLVGNNGIGKSSILESFDSFFNGKIWNTNTGFKKASTNTASPHIVPVFMIKKNELPEKYHEAASWLTQLSLQFDERSIGSPLTPTTRPSVITFIEHLKKISRNNIIDDFFIIPLGCDSNGTVNLSILNCKLLVEIISPPADFIENNRLKNTPLITYFQELFEFLKIDYEYIYIPKDIDPETFTKLETSEIQKLMGESLENIIKQKIPNQTISKINTELNGFISEIEKELQIYSYRTSGDRQQNLKRRDVYNLIIDAFFRIRKLNKRDGANWIEISSLSSGEKQRAIIDIVQGFLTNHRENGDKLLIGIDEPECSLHMSACFEQFENLYQTSKNCRQLLFTTHWYGYLPTVEDGCTTSIIRESLTHHFDLYDLAGYREEIKRKAKDPREKIPYDIRLKSTNDLIQSIISSTLSDNPYNWLICEGSTEKLYLGYYLKDLVATKKLRIVPVGGAKEVKKIFQLLEASHDDLKKDIKGKVYLLSDTDREILSYQVNNIEKIKCKRIINDPTTNSTLLVDSHSVKVSPPTEIENCLNGHVFSETLKTFFEDHDYLKELVDGKDLDNDMISYFSMDLRPGESKTLDHFFDTDGVKYEFAKRYIYIDELFNSEDYRNPPPPTWIEEIKNFFL